MSVIRSGQLENWERKWADNDLDKAYLFSNSIAKNDDTLGYCIHDDKSGTFLFSLYEYVYDDEMDVYEECERYEEYIMEKYLSYKEALNSIRRKENEDLYKAEKTFSRSISF